MIGIMQVIEGAGLMVIIGLPLGAILTILILNP